MIRRLKLANWKSHASTEIDFERGTNVIVGRMGSGKSSILQALSFGLFGEIPEVRSRKLSIGNLVMRRPKRAESAEIEVEFEVDGIIYTVRRTVREGQGDAELYKEGRLWEQGITRVTRKVQELLGIDFMTFTQVVYARQNEIDQFLRLGKGDRTSLIDGLLKIDRMTEARSNLLSLRRSQEKRLEDLRILAEEGTDEVDKKINSLAKEIEVKQNELRQLNSLFEKLSAEKTKLQKSCDDMENSRSLLESMEKTKEGFVGKIQLLEKQVRQLPDIEGAEKKLEKLEAELRENQQKLSVIRSKIISNERELDELREKQAKIKTAEAVLLKPVEDVSDKINETVETLGALRAEVQSREDAVRQLKTATATCPVCGHMISDPAKHIERHKSRLEKLGAEIRRFEAVLEALHKKQKQNDKLRVEIKKAQELVAGKEQVQGRIKQLKAFDAGRELKALEGVIRRQDARRDELRNAVECRKKKAQLEVIKSELKDIDSKLKSIHYDKAKHHRVREDLEKIVGELSRVQANVRIIPEIIRDKQTLLSELSSKRDKIIEAGKILEKSESAIEALKILSNALIDVQILVRRKFVEVVNELLSDIWSRLYPYGDYDGIRIFVEEDGRKAGDYVLQLHESGGWVNVDGSASGGERSMASLSLRVAFARALSRMGTLLLDEPTHNLDSEGIQKLIEVLREGMPEVLDQVILITHENDMEKAATGLSYRLMRESNQATLVERFE